jgi:hypothetical protein
VDEGAYTHVDLVVESADEELAAVRRERDGGRRAADFNRSDRILRALRSALPDADGTVVARAREELNARAWRERAVERVHDAPVRAQPAHALARTGVREPERVVRAGGVDEWGRERPLDVENGRLVQVRQQRRIRVRWVRPPYR